MGAAQPKLEAVAVAGDWLIEDGEIARLIRERDWSGTPLGPRDQWSTELKVLINTMLANPMPMALFLGRELLVLYNDAYKRVLGPRHPVALGRSNREVWPEIYEITNPIFKRVMDRGVAVLMTDHLLPIRRLNDRIEDSWFTVSYSPFFSPQGMVQGVQVTLIETTRRVQAERQLRESTEHLRLLFQNMKNGFAECRMERNEAGQPIDFTYLAVNPAFEESTGLKGVVGRRVSEVVPGIEESNPELLETYARVAATGRPESLEVYIQTLKMWFSISAYSIKPGTFVTVFEIINAKKELEESLKQALKSRDELFSIASHELRTPLAALVMQMNLIQKFIGSGDTKKIEQAEGLCASASQSLKTMDLLLSDLMDLGRIRAGKFSMRPESVDLRTLIEEVIHGYSALLSASGSTLTFIPENPVVGHWDPARIREVLSNLLSNAIKYGEGKPIELWQGFDAIRQSAIIRVTDRGMGVAPEVRGRLFERFERGISEPEVARRISGLGLGLYIARQIVEAHQGEISYEPAPRGGSVFTVRLPLNST